MKSSATFHEARAGTAIIGLISVAWVVLAFFPTANAAKPSGPQLRAALMKDMAQHKDLEFKTLLDRWETKHGARAFEPLRAIAHDRKADDAHRYIAVMGLARLGGEGAWPRIEPLAKDRSWMLRNASLRAIRVLAARDRKALHRDSMRRHTLRLLRDPALVVRTEAVETVEILQPKGAVRELLAVLKDPTNYRNGKAQWVPQRALKALARLKAPAWVAKDIAPLLERADRDPDLARAAVRALEDITGIRARPGAPLSERARPWRAIAVKKTRANAIN